MSSVDRIIQAIKQLTPDELVQIEAAVDARRQEIRQTPPPDSEALISLIHEVFDNFWEGVPESRVDEIINDMNSEYIEPDRPDLYDWPPQEAQS